MQDFSPGTRSALVVAHPSHELRVHGWLQIARPRVLVLTDGSGRSGQSRLAATTAVLADAGAERGSLYGYTTDVDLYAAMLRTDATFFVELVELIAADLGRAAVEYVVSDAAEGYSSAHDLCAVLVEAATTLVERREHRAVPRFDFPVVAVPDVGRAADDGELGIDLDDVTFARKILAARGYHPKLAAEIESALLGEPLQGIRRFSEPHVAGEVDAEVIDLVLTRLRSRPDLAATVQQVLGGVPLDAYRREILRPVREPACGERAEAPFYELYGEQLVAAGRYRQVIRFREHLLPIAAALRRHVDADHRECP